MKPPQNPPGASDPDEEFKLLRRRPTEVSVEPFGKYLHWDDLRHRTPPAEVSHITWWSVVKLLRAHRALHLPLHDATGMTAEVVNSDSVQRACMRCDQRLAGSLAVPGLPRNDRTSHLARSLIEEAIASSQLEGASTTRAQAIDLIGSQRAPRNQHEAMVVGNFLAMEWVRDHAPEPLTLAALFDLHRLVMHAPAEEAETLGAGRLRTPADDVVVHDAQTGEVVHVPPPADQLAARMDALLTFANQAADQAAPFLHPVVRAIVLHFWIAYDHPFTDGNGRTARALFHWSMKRQGYWLTDYISISRIIKRARAQYDRAFLLSETDDLDLTYFVVHQLDVIEKAFETLERDLAVQANHLRDLEGVVRGSDLNTRQRTLLSSALRDPQSTTVAAHAIFHGVSNQTARTDLLDLVRRGYFSQYTEGKKLQVFMPVRDLLARLKAPPKRR